MSFTLTLLFAASLAGPIDDGEEDAIQPASVHLASLQRGMRGRRSSDDLERDDATRLVIASIDHMTSDYETYDDKTKGEVARGVAKLLSIWTDAEDDQIHFAAAAALSEMGSDGAELIRRTRSVSHLQRNIDVRCMLIEALGKHRDPKDVDYFVKLLSDDEPKVIVSAANALAEYYDAEQSLRKRIAQGLLKVYVKAHRANEKHHGENEEAYYLLVAIEVPLNHALDRMTAQNLQSAPEWDAWLKRHLSDDW